MISFCSPLLVSSKQTETDIASFISEGSYILTKIVVNFLWAL